MITMSKEQMIQYLRDYANVQDIMMHNPNMPIGRAFDRYMKENGRYEDATREYYDRMRRVYMSYNIFKRFSIIEDFLLNRDDFLSNNDLAGIETDCQIIEAPSDITNKKIVQLIRDAFNHNDSPNFDKFRISENSKNFEIEFMDIRKTKELARGGSPKPIRIKFNIDYLLKVEEIINRKRQNQLFLSFDIPDDFDIFSKDLDKELDKITFIHYYFGRKLSRETIEKFNELADTKGLTTEELKARSDELHTFAQAINSPARFHLDKYQKRKLKELITRYKVNYRKMLDDDINGVMYYFLERIIPVPALKAENINQQIFLCLRYYEDTRFSINEVLKRVARVLNKEDKPTSYDNYDNETHDILVNRGYSYSRSLFKNILDGEFIQMLPIITYIDSVVTHYCTDKYIEIAGRKYAREKIRNSLAHGRWYITQNFKISMYDADPRNKNDYNLEFIGNIDIDLFKNWADKYMEEAVKQRKKTK